jgi:hypothetical protein
MGDRKDALEGQLQKIEQSLSAYKSSLEPHSALSQFEFETPAFQHILLAKTVFLMFKNIYLLMFLITFRS